MKVMNVDRITSYYLRKLHTEISILKSLDHPNIIKIQDVFFGKRSVYIVTDLCRGGELFELLNSGKNQGFVFREDRAAKLMRDMLSAVNYLHEHGRNPPHFMRSNIHGINSCRIFAKRHCAPRFETGELFVRRSQLELSTHLDRFRLVKALLSERAPHSEGWLLLLHCSRSAQRQLRPPLRRVVPWRAVLYASLR